MRSPLQPARPFGSLRTRLLVAMGGTVQACYAVVVGGCQAPVPSAPAPADQASGPSASMSSASPLASASTLGPSLAVSASIAVSNSAPAPIAVSNSAPPPIAVVVSPAEREDPTACRTRITKCYPARQLTAGDKVVQRELHWDKNGCLPKAETAGACAAFFPTSEPRFTGGQCCYQGCAGPLIKCGRPLLRRGEPVLAAIVPTSTWTTPS